MANKIQAVGSGSRGARWNRLCVLTGGWLLGCGDGDPTYLADVEEAESLPGGDTTNRLLRGQNAFTPPADNITVEHEAAFFTGNSFFNQGWVRAPSSTETRDGLGPLFNARSCAACHFKDGRGRPPLDENEAFLGLLLRLSVEGRSEHGAPQPEPNYGGQLQPFALRELPAEGNPIVEYRVVPGQYADGVTFRLLEPSYRVEDLAYGSFAEDVRISPRVAPAVIGLGLLEAIPLSRLESLADPDDSDGDGISGKLNRVWSVRAQSMVPGRFGWKAEQPSVEQQTAGAFLGDIGITSPLMPEPECSPTQPGCRSAISGGEPEISEHLLARVTLYSKLLAVPEREQFASRAVRRGKWLFSDIGCDGCHVPRHETGIDPEFPELSGQAIFPYTDLLLHDMGEALSDHRPSFDAAGNEWRTPPLWGLRYYEVVNGHDRLLHDGRARGVAEAILWHGGEAESVRESFRALPRPDRDALVEFIRSL